jgi:hypothetical protein
MLKINDFQMGLRVISVVLRYVFAENKQADRSWFVGDIFVKKRREKSAVH